MNGPFYASKQHLLSLCRELALVAAPAEAAAYRAAGRYILTANELTTATDRADLQTFLRAMQRERPELARAWQQLARAAGVELLEEEPAPFLLLRPMAWGACQ